MPVAAVWNKCDNRCVMCTNGDEFSSGSSEQYTLKKQIEKMERYLRGDESVYYKGGDDPGFLALTGGEPTMHPDFFKLITYFRRRLPGVHISLLSNGRRFADAAFSEKYASAAAPPFGTIIPLHSSAAAEHDFISGASGSFGQTVAGLKNLFRLLGPEHGIEIRYIQHGVGKDRLKRTLGFLLNNFPDTARYRVSVIHYEIEGQSAKNEKMLHLSLSESAARLLDAADIMDKFSDLSIYHLPVCAVDERLRKRLKITLPPEERVYPEDKCAGCAARRACLGLMDEYYRRFGDSELRTVKR